MLQGNKIYVVLESFSKEIGFLKYISEDVGLKGTWRRKYSEHY
nr:hypothetical protein [Mycoplasmopsis bovis]